MAGKKKVEAPVYPEVPLTLSREKFCELLREQIAKGNELLAIDVPKVNQMTGYGNMYDFGFAPRRRDSVKYEETARNNFIAKYNQWNDRNKTIYRTSFAVAESIYFHEYEKHIWDKFYSSDLIDDYKKEITRLMNHMQGDIERSDLMKCQMAIVEDKKEKRNQKKKRPLVFISHRGTQTPFVTAFVELLEKCGFKSENLFCSSVPGFNIGLDEDIIETLRKKFVDYDLYVVYVFSTDFFESAYCLNEMGAAWVLQVENSIIVTRDMDETVIDGVVNKTKTRVSFKDSDLQLKNRMVELRNKLLTFAGIPEVEEVNWNRYYDKFISDVKSINGNGANNKTVASRNSSVSFSTENPDDVVQKAIYRLGEFSIHELQDATGIQNYRFMMQKINAYVKSEVLEPIGDNVHRRYRLKV